MAHRSLYSHTVLYPTKRKGAGNWQIRLCQCKMIWPGAALQTPLTHINRLGHVQFSRHHNVHNVFGLWWGNQIGWGKPTRHMTTCTIYTERLELWNQTHKTWWVTSCHFSPVLFANTVTFCRNWWQIDNCTGTKHTFKVKRIGRWRGSCRILTKLSA